ncbi:MAG: Fe-S cluster protein, partial [Nocardioidaceae bacterium]|nr:Fe-S cluster protein [Nocardioidaceae bacterium]
RINLNRTKEAVETGADQIAVGCPFCRVMLSDGLTLKQSEGKAREEVEVLDVAQLLLEAVRRGKVEPEVEETEAVVAEAEAATAAAVVTEPEPSPADEANPDSISKTEDVGPAAEASSEGASADHTAGQSVEELNAPHTEGDGVTEDDKAVAAQHNVPVDDAGSATGEAPEGESPAEELRPDGDEAPTEQAARDEEAEAVEDEKPKQ